MILAVLLVGRRTRCEWCSGRSVALPFLLVRSLPLPEAVTPLSNRGWGFRIIAHGETVRATDVNGPTETEWRRQPRGVRTSRRGVRYCRGRSRLKSDRKAEIRSIPPTRITKAKNFLFLGQSDPLSNYHFHVRHDDLHRTLRRRCIVVTIEEGSDPLEILRRGHHVDDADRRPSSRRNTRTGRDCWTQHLDCLVG
jgi:hypothetical protein